MKKVILIIILIVLIISETYSDSRNIDISEMDMQLNSNGPNELYQALGAISDYSTIYYDIKGKVTYVHLNATEQYDMTGWFDYFVSLIAVAQNFSNFGIERNKYSAEYIMEVDYNRKLYFAKDNSITAVDVIKYTLLENSLQIASNTHINVINPNYKDDYSKSLKYGWADGGYIDMNYLNRKSPSTKSSFDEKFIYSSIHTFEKEDVEILFRHLLLNTDQVDDPFLELFASDLESKGYILYDPKVGGVDDGKIELFVMSYQSIDNGAFYYTISFSSPVSEREDGLVSYFTIKCKEENLEKYQYFFLMNYNKYIGKNSIEFILE